MILYKNVKIKESQRYLYVKGCQKYSIVRIPIRGGKKSENIF